VFGERSDLFMPRAAPVRPRRVLRALGVLAGVALASAGAAVVWVRSDGGQEVLRAHVEPALRARLGAVPSLAGIRLSFVPPAVVIEGLTIPEPDGCHDVERVLFEAQQVRVRPSLRAALRGEARPAVVRVRGAHAVIARCTDGRLNVVAAAAARALSKNNANKSLADDDAGPGGARVLVDGLVVDTDPALRLPRPLARRLSTLVAADLVVEHDGPTVRARGRVDLAQPDDRAPLARARIEVDAGDPAHDDTVHVEADVGDLAAVVATATRGRTGAVAAGRARLTLTVTRALDDELLAHVHAEGEGLTVVWQSLASRPVTLDAASLDAQVVLDGARRTLRVSPAVATFGRVDLPFSLTLEAPRGERLGRASLARTRFAVEASVTHLRYADLVASVPDAVSARLREMNLSGALSARLRIGGDVGTPGTWKIDHFLDPGEARDAAGLAELRHAFSMEAPLPDGPGTRRITVDPRTRDFVPLSEVPAHVRDAVLVAEDAGFYGHAGLAIDETWQAVLDAIERGERLRGASTLTQQLAKNLFTGGARTFVRKVEEAVLALALEAALSKHRLFEIYLNVIEWGPGIYGLRAAAHHYFDAEPWQLSVREGAFLATIIPNPKRYHGYRTRGALTPRWNERVAELLGKLAAAGKISAEAHDQALAETLRFAGASAPATSAPESP
jgi:hypothetical protein